MKHMLLSSLGCVYALSLVSVALADDWPQFRHDSTHTAASKDGLRFPLKEAWSWSKRGANGHTPLYHCVVWHDSVYFTGSEGNKRYIICADCRTGKVKWRKPLASEKLAFAISDIAGPAVSENGTVFVYDWITITGRTNEERDQLTAMLNGLVTYDPDCSMTVDMLEGFAVRTFNTGNGAEGPVFPLAGMGANGVLKRLSLIDDNLSGQLVRAVPATFAGCPP